MKWEGIHVDGRGKYRTILCPHSGRNLILKLSYPGHRPAGSQPWAMFGRAVGSSRTALLGRPVRQITQTPRFSDSVSGVAPNLRGRFSDFQSAVAPNLWAGFSDSLSAVAPNLRGSSWTRSLGVRIWQSRYCYLW